MNYKWNGANGLFVIWRLYGVAETALQQPNQRSGLSLILLHMTSSWIGIFTFTTKKMGKTFVRTHDVYRKYFENQKVLYIHERTWWFWCKLPYHFSHLASLGSRWDHKTKRGCCSRHWLYCGDSIGAMLSTPLWWLWLCYSGAEWLCYDHFPTSKLLMHHNRY